MRSRVRLFIHTDIVQPALEQIRRTRDAECFALFAYCFMPDHLHLLVGGMTETSDLRRFSKLAKQRSGAEYALKHGAALWQEGYHDRVLRDEDDTRAIARYILANPVRAGLVKDPRLYAFSGSDVWTLDELLEGVS